jgi:hypothetical protein
MKNIYTAFLLSLSFNLAFGQQSLVPTSKQIPELKERTARPETNTLRGGGGEIIWSDDFSDPSTWVIDHDETASNLDWEIGQNLGCGGFAPIDTIQSTTKFNGYALIDSDEYGGQTGGTEIEDCWLTTATPINLSGYPNVVLEFETQYYKYNSEECYVVTSTDGITWPDLTPFTDISGMDNVYRVWPGMDQQDLVENPTLKRINISQSAGGESQVWIRFHWTGTWGYAWFVDDMRIVPQPANDIILESTYISHNSSGIQYGTVPSNQTGQAMTIGGGVYNFGYTNQTNLSFDADFNLFNVSDTYSLLESDSSQFMQGTNSTVLNPGYYSGIISVESDDDNQISGINYSNNTELRSFNVSDDLYAIDNLAVGGWGGASIGTDSYNSDFGDVGLYSRYDVADEITISGLTILLDADNTSVGATVFASLQPVFDFSNGGAAQIGGLAYSEQHTITQEDIDAESVFIPFESPYTVSNDSIYAGVYLQSDGNVYDIRILDDESQVQPFDASMILLDDNGTQTTYNNGEALAIRMNLCTSTTSQIESSCNSYDWNGNTYTQSGNYTVGNPSGICETLELTIFESETDFQFYALCPDESVLVGAVEYSAPGSYTQNLFTQNGCDSTVSIEVTVETEPALTILGNGTITPNTLETYAFVNPGGYSITWSAVNGTIISGQGTSSANIFWDGTGGGEVIVTLSSGNCVYPYTLPVGTFVGIENQWIGDLQIHPNPSSGLFNIELPEITQIAVLDATGRKVTETTGNGRFTLDLGLFPTGTYTLQLRTENLFGAKQLVKY